MYSLQNVCLSLAGLKVLRGVNLNIREGFTTALIGPSGSGKSTILRVMTGLLEPDSGSVEYAGRELCPATIEEVRHRVGYVIQGGGLFPHLTARENITLVARYLKWSSGRIAAAVNELAEVTHFPRKGLDRHPHQLSGGQLQRVSLMRALMLDPEVILMDEPLGSVDPLVRAELQQELRDIFEAVSKTVVLVTHDLAEAAYFGHTIVLLRGGEVVQEGSISDLVDRPADDFVHRFVRSQQKVLAELPFTTISSEESS